jgi:hypothetical protein
MSVKLFHAVKPRAFTRLITGCAVALLLSPAVFAMDDDGDEFEQMLTNLGVDADARAEAEYETENGGAEIEFEVEVEDLVPGSYEVYVGADLSPKGTLIVDAEGEGELKFESPQDSGLLLDFTVIGELIEIRQGATVFFSSVFSPGAGSVDDIDDENDKGKKIKIKIETYMTNVGSDFDATGEVEFESEKGEVEFKVKAKKLAAGMYELRVGGQTVSSHLLVGDDDIEWEFESPFDDDDDDDSDDGGVELEAELTFDPLGKLIEIVLVDPILMTEEVILSVLLPASPATTGTKPPKKGKGGKDTGKNKGDALEMQMLDMGVLPGAEGEAEYEQDDDENEFEVEVESVPAGSYVLLVDSVVRGPIVVPTGKKAKGKIKFSTDPEGSETLLDFEVKGKLIEVQSAGITILSILFPTTVQAAVGKLKKETSKPGKIKVNLISTGEDFDTVGLVDYKSKNGKSKMKVSIEDLSVGTYKVCIAGVERGTLSITKPDGKAKLDFDSKLTAPSSNGMKAPLDFLVEGLLLEIKDASDVLLLQVVVD